MFENVKSLELKKHIGTIHSSNGMSLLQRKIANGLLYNAYDALLEKNEHKINIQYLCELIGFSSNDTTIIKKALINLLSTVVEWNLIDKKATKTTEHEVWNASSIIADASIKGSQCTYSYSNRMRQLLYHPEIYGRLNMGVQAKFQSSYGLALYENCIRYQNLGQTPWLDFSVFRKLMGVGENKYVIFRDFKKRVLDIAILEVNKYAPIFVQPELKKEERKVVSIRFLIQKQGNEDKKMLQLQDDGEKTEESFVTKLKQTFGMSQKQITEVMEKYDEHYVLEKILLVESSSSYLQGTIENLAKYLLSALENDYQVPKTSKKIIKEIKINSYISEQEERKRIAQKEELDKKYDDYRRQKIINNFYSFNDENAQNSILEKFLKRIEINRWLRGNYFKTGLDHPAISVEFCLFLKESNSNLFDGIMSKEQFSNGEC